MSKPREQRSKMVPYGAIVKLHKAGLNPRKIVKKTGTDRQTVEAVIAEYERKRR